MADFATAVKYKLPIKVVIIKNNTLGQIKWEQMVFLGNPEYGVDLSPIDFVAFAHACGGVGYTVDDPKDCGQTVEQFLNAPGPAILEAVVDPFEPPSAGKSQGRPGAPLRPVAGPRRAESQQDRAHGCIRQSSRGGVGMRAINTMKKMRNRKLWSLPARPLE